MWSTWMQSRRDDAAAGVVWRCCNPLSLTCSCSSKWFLPTGGQCITFWVENSLKAQRHALTDVPSEAKELAQNRIDGNYFCCLVKCRNEWTDSLFWATLYLYLPPSPSSLSMQFNRTEHHTGFLFVIYSAFKSPSTNFLAQMAQQMRSGVSAQLSLSLCSHLSPISAILSANWKYPTKATGLLHPLYIQ